MYKAAKLSLHQIFEGFLNHESQIFRTAINFKNGKEFEKNLMLIFDENKINYTYQPNGSQDFPDFCLYHHNKKINIECKTSANGKLLWNSGFPHSNMILLYASNVSKRNDITFVLGEDLTTDKIRIDIKSWVKRYRDILKNEFNSKFDLPDWTFYLRDMYNNSTNYLSDNRRFEWQHRVLDFLLV